MFSLQKILLRNERASHNGKMFKKHISRNGSVCRIYTISEPQRTLVFEDKQGTS